MAKDIAASAPDIPVVYEDEDVVVINKPAGLLVHPDGKSTEPTVCDWVLAHYPQMAGVGEPLVLSSGVVIDRPGIVHRIDRETSGALVIAKNEKTFNSLKQQFKDHVVEKRYRAFVYGKVMRAFGTIDRALGRSKKDFRQYTDPLHARGEMRPALTHFALLKAGEKFSYLEASPKTGRTHQIRVHLKSIQHPIVCDRVYAGDRPCELGFGRLALHAHTVAFTLPGGRRVSAEAPLPEDFLRAEKLI
ncbi:RNA pseudouridine synthase [Candidatus Parcubacteria bacterium]|nr:RNA pseudouridine synthase [Candidatus Parcubacteria bacterium]